MNTLQFTPLALQDLEDIHDYIAEDSPSAALRFLSRLEKRCQSVARTPGIGRRRPELAENLQSVAEGNYVIFYRPNPQGVEVVRVLHGARDVYAIFHVENSE